MAIPKVQAFFDEFRFLHRSFREDDFTSVAVRRATEDILLSRQEDRTKISLLDEKGNIVAQTERHNPSSSLFERIISRAFFIFSDKFGGESVSDVIDRVGDRTREVKFLVIHWTNYLCLVKLPHGYNNLKEWLDRLRQENADRFKEES